MGCPQGSVLGPYLWNIGFDDFLAIPIPSGCTLNAYADDGLLLVESDTRAGLERRGRFASSISHRKAFACVLSVRTDFRTMEAEDIEIFLNSIRNYPELYAVGHADYKILRFLFNTDASNNNSSSSESKSDDWDDPDDILK
ncbi:unnamed protein product [Arctia plantaginis]|uniref:Reverse transcriptase domain-containing protein n=1 Tax=Arctia plantaginis TaxID=874455 RepID=A0A8S1BNH6_ARCPL|nr:unnamed protein product [Arctia plantaginis]